MANNKRFITKNGVDVNSNTIINVSNPLNAQDAATKSYVDTSASGLQASLDTEESARIAGDSATLSSAQSYADSAEADAIAAAEAKDVVRAAAANAYTDGRETAITTAYQSYADSAEADAITSANTYTDGRETAITTAYQAYADSAEADAITSANAYTDGRETAITTAYQAADTALDSAKVSKTSAQALAADANALTASGNILTLKRGDGTTDTVDLSLYLDDTNAAVIQSGVVDGAGIATFTRDDLSTFTVDMSLLLDDTNLPRITSAGWNTGNGVLTLTRNDATTITVDLDDRYSLGSHNHSLDSLSNATITSNTAGEILKWNGSAWINNTLAEAGIQAAGNYITTATTFGGDVSGTYNAIVVADDSHNHVISNVDGLQTALDGKYSTSNPAGYTTNTGTVTSVSGTGTVSGLTLTGSVTSSGSLTLGGAITGFATSGHNHTLDSLSNTTITTNTAGEVLVWNGSAWVNNTLAEAGIQPAGSYQPSGTYNTIIGIDTDYALTGANVFSGLTLTDGVIQGVTTRALTAGDIGAATSGHNHTLDSLSNTTITTNTAGEVLVWNGSAWVNNTLAEAGIQPAGSYLTGTKVDSFNTRTGDVTLSSSDVTTALGFTPYNSTNPSGYTTNTGTVTSVSGTGTVSGLTLTGSVTSSGSLTLGGAITGFATSGHNHTLDSLSNTTITSNTAGEVLVWNGSAWVNNTLAEAGIYSTSNPAGYTTNTGTVTSVSGTGTVSGLTLTGSVTTTGSLTLGGAITGFATSGHNHTLDSLSNTTITSNTAGEILKWNGSAWINNTLAEAGIQPAGSYSLTSHNHTLDSLSNVTITGNTAGEILKWDGAAWINNTATEAGIATESYVTTAISNLVNGADAAYDTLVEIQNAMATDAELSAAIAAITIGNGTVTVNTGSGLTGSGSFTMNQTGATTVTLSHADTSTAANLTASGRTYVSGLTFDTYGHVTGYTTGTETVVDTNTTSLPVENSAGTVQFTSTQATGIQFAGSGATSVAFDAANQRVTFSSTDTNTTYTAGTGLTLSGTTFSNTAPDQTVTLTGSGATSVSGTYPNFTISSTDTNTVYTLPAATSTVLGGIELFSDTVQSVAANAVSATASRTYGVQVNAAGQAVVNVPWVDTNTTYSVATTGANGLMSSTDKTKLDGIEAGATADQTKADIDALGIAASTAATLATARTIGMSGVTATATSFNGGADITIPVTAVPATLLTGVIADARISGSYTGMTNLTGSGTVDFSKFLGNAADSITAPSFSWTGDTNTGIYQPAADQLGITTGGVSRAIVSATGLSVTGAITATGDVTAYSDDRLKTDITTIDGALDKVAKVRGVNFTRKEDGSRSTGVVAQELAAVLPEAVKTDEYGMHHVAYGNITGLLIEAIKELKDEIDYLKGLK